VKQNFISGAQQICEFFSQMEGNAVSDFDLFL
jgi:hypothetical protein